MEGRSDQLREFEKRRRRLPHWEGPGETYFLTLTLQRPPTVDLTEPRFARLAIQALRHFDGIRYDLYDYTVMPDHVHVILKPIVREGKCERLSRIMHSLKSWLAHRINEMVGRRGRIWQEETYDHVIRNKEDYEEKAAYILDNPRRKGLIKNPVNWPWWGIGSAGREGNE